MRTMKKAFLSCAIVAAAGWLATTPAMATGSCTISANYVTVVGGPCPVASETAPACGSSGPWTGILYKAAGWASGDVVSTLVTINNSVYAPGGTCPSSGPSSSGNCIPANSACAAAFGGGDLITDLGEYSCHEQALRIKVMSSMSFPDGSTGPGFWVLVKGNKQPLPTSISVKRGSCIKSVAILGLGLDIPEGCVSTCGNFNAHQAVKNLQIVQWEGCVITKYFSPTTGAFQGVTVTSPDTTPPTVCSIVVGDYMNQFGNPPRPVTDLALTDTSGAKTMTFVDGDATTGDNSCFNTFVGGVYARVCK